MLFESSIDEIVAAVREALASGITEVHMVGGLHPTLDKHWYLDLLTRLLVLDTRLAAEGFYRDRNPALGSANIQDVDP